MSIYSRGDRKLPVRPDLDQLKHQAKDLLRAIRRGDAEALAELQEFHPNPPSPETAQLADAQLALARSYQASSWPRLLHAVQLADAIWSDDLDAVRDLITRNPALIREEVLIRTNSNWGPPMTYAANLGRNDIIRFLYDRGAGDAESATERAALQGKVDTVHLITDLAGRPSGRLSLAGPAYTLSVEGTAALFSLGANIVGPNGVDHNAMEHLLGTDSRKPAAKHRILEMYIEHGFEPPDTPIMAFHRGRIDLLEEHLERDPALFSRTFDITEVFVHAPACSHEPYAAQGTPVQGTTLLHLAAYFDEIEIAEWLLEKGMDPNVASAIDAGGFGGYTALFSTVVSQPNFWMNYNNRGPYVAPFTQLLLDHGADPNIRASLRTRLEEGHGGGPYCDYCDVTPLGWGEQFNAKVFVSEPAMKLIAEHGGKS
jgi:hypothetical protein